MAGTAVVISAQLADARNNPVHTSGVVVTWSKTETGAWCSSATSTTDASGIATVTFTTGTTAGTNYTVTATDGSSRTGTSSTMTTTPGLASQIAVSAGDNQSATEGTEVTTAPSVIVKDANGNPVSGVSVAFAVATGGGSATGASATTNTSGIATVGRWTLGTTAGANTLTATGIGLFGSPVTFTATGTAGAASKCVLTTQPGGAVNGVALTGAPVVQLEDSGGNYVTTSGVNVVASIDTGSGTLSGTVTVATDGNGTATFSNLIITGTAGSYTLTFTPVSLTATTSNSFTLAAGAASKLVIETQPPATTDSAAVLVPHPVVEVQDSAGSVVTTSNASITVTTSPGSTLGGTMTRSATNGVASFTDLTLAGTVDSAYLLHFASGLLAGATSDPITVTLTIGTPYGGGVVAYILQPGDPSYVAGETRGLIAATADQSSGIQWALPAYQHTLLGGTSSAIGSGLANTNAIIAQNGAGTTYAAGLARAYNGGGHSDWYLPSQLEMTSSTSTKGQSAVLGPATTGARPRTI